MNYYIAVLKNYAKFSGRAQRAEYWYFVLFNFIIGLVLGFVDNATDFIIPGTTYGVLGGLYSIAIIIPGIAVAVRRLHDTNHSGWNYLWILFIIIGWLYLLYLLVLDSDKGSNKYGPNPKEGTSANVPQPPTSSTPPAPPTPPTPPTPPAPPVPPNQM